ncbi:cytochrome P450 family protein [Mycolicibacterium lacusdiani]|uniref:cytochrome P450 family protein n=1 Tax=Mycolicibacterium lacusdiani TaxID=2895283 RepID=UPI001F18C672|nr:cytochrome P450 [Mycolicibacterium lacusdiani]
MTAVDGPALWPLDVSAPSFKADPFRHYARLRAEAPVVRVSVRRFGSPWLITRYTDVADVLKDQRLVKNKANALTSEEFERIRKPPRVLAPLQSGLLDADGLDHRRMRALVRSAFTTARIERMRRQAETLADELLDSALRRGEVDLVADYALPIPLVLIARILGVPEEDAPRFSTWSKALIGAPNRRFPATALPSVLGFLRYLRRLIAERTLNPRDDLISALVTARDCDDRLTHDEVLAMVVLLLTAGHETTVNLIASGTLALLQNPGQMALVRDEPDSMGAAVEELIRFVVPAEMATQRHAREDIVIADTIIRRGDLVLAVLASANRDAAQFSHPDRLDVSRSDNRHLSFGQGAHYCLGAPLARLEAQVAMNTLLRRAPRLRLAVPPERLRWRGGLILRGLTSLPVTLTS